ncbi:MAG: TIGR00296 family protein [Candidatus Lokiarchaeota archaeon]|nr:TIGR00296 family protein [Candidatus Lokiarchaeota archaeon]
MTEGELFTIEDGRKLIKFARENIEYYLKNNRRMPVPKELREQYSNKYGAFVTLNTYSEKETQLRGCIGYIEPKYSLYDVIHKVSISSAIEDPRFPSVSLEELKNIAIEISILTPPELLEVDKPSEYLEKIKIGRDGLIAEKGIRRGLLLPQVPVDHDRNWDVKTFLSHTCQKAWLHSDAWKEKDTKIYSFRAIIFEEIEPKGEIKRKYIGKEDNN